jgi:hypothetical protein
MHDQSPHVTRLPVHLPNEQTICFLETATLEDLLAKNNTTLLTAYFELNKNDNFAKTLKYTEIPTHYTWDSKNKKWNLRKRLN